MKKQTQTTEVTQHRSPRKAWKQTSEADRVNPTKWAKELVANMGPVEALRVASNYAGDTLGKAPDTITNVFKGFYSHAVAEIKKHLPKDKQNVQH